MTFRTVPESTAGSCQRSDPDSHPADAVATNLAKQFERVRALTMRIAAPLSAEDCAIQSMPDASPTRWHLAHTTWFFETFLLKKLSSYEPFDDSFEYLFNSYYNTVGKQFPRHRRGQISRPGLEATKAYRRSVDELILRYLETSESPLPESVTAVLTLGLHHEQQHQELMLTDIKHVLAGNPLYPVYDTASRDNSKQAADLDWGSFDAGIVEIGHDSTEFAFDNESPRHSHYAHAFELATRCVTNGEYLNFIEDGGYRRPEFWLSMGWSQVQTDEWSHPLYWLRRDEKWFEFSLSGLVELDLQAPACHLSYFEAEAYARWAGCRLPTEFEWESAASQHAQPEGVFANTLLDDGICIHPRTEVAEDTTGGTLQNLLGNMWEWTSSQYSPYPGFAAARGALGEYNGKFMCNQFVLRGGSCATSSDHIRPTYRNFFPPETRWQFSGIRLAR